MPAEGRAASARRARVRRSVESYKSAAEAIGPLEPGMAIFAVTRGSWSMIDAIRYVLDEAGPAHVSAWSWCVASYERETLAGLMRDARLLSGTLVVDRSMERRRVEIIDQWRETFGPSSVKTCLNHSKLARVHNDRWRCLLRGSLNLNFSPRFENFDLTEGGEDFDLVTKIEQGLPVLRRLPTYDEAAYASGVTRAFDLETLALFRGLKPWQP